MTKERLEELIKQEKVIYTSRFKKPDKFKLYKDYFVDKNELWCLNKRIGICDCVIKLDKLFETKDQAEWHAKMAAERTERFEPPMWEDIENEYLFNFVVNNEHLHFFVNKERELISVMNEAHFYLIFHKANVSKNLLKKGYEKACEIVRDLFKGEK